MKSGKLILLFMITLFGICGCGKAGGEVSTPVMSSHPKILKSDWLRWADEINGETTLSAQLSTLALHLASSSRLPELSQMASVKLSCSSEKPNRCKYTWED